MNKKHVPSLELCQELDRLCKENNITLPETEFYWNIKNKTLTSKPYRYIHTTKYSNLPSPLVSEQGEWLPFGYCSMKSGSMFKKASYICGRSENGEGKDCLANTEPNARQKMINYLIAEGIITKL